MDELRPIGVGRSNRIADNVSIHEAPSDVAVVETRELLYHTTASDFKSCLSRNDGRCLLRKSIERGLDMGTQWHGEHGSIDDSQALHSTNTEFSIDDLAHGTGSRGMPCSSASHGQPLVELFVTIVEGQRLGWQSLRYRLASNELSKFGAQHELGELSETRTEHILVHFSAKIVEVDYEGC